MADTTVETTNARAFGLGGYVNGSKKTSTRPSTFGLARYTAASVEARTTRIPTLWTKKERYR